MTAAGGAAVAFSCRYRSVMAGLAPAIHANIGLSERAISRHANAADE